MTAEEWRDYLDWLVEWRDDTGSLLFVWVRPDGAEQPVLMPAVPFPWWAETTSLLN